MRSWLLKRMACVCVASAVHTYMGQYGGAGGGQALQGLLLGGHHTLHHHHQHAQLSGSEGPPVLQTGAAGLNAVLWRDTATSDQPQYHHPGDAALPGGFVLGAPCSLSLPSR